MNSGTLPNSPRHATLSIHQKDITQSIRNQPQSSHDTAKNTSTPDHLIPSLTPDVAHPTLTPSFQQQFSSQYYHHGVRPTKRTSSTPTLTMAEHSPLHVAPTALQLQLLHTLLWRDTIDSAAPMITSSTVWGQNAPSKFSPSSLPSQPPGSSVYNSAHLPANHPLSSHPYTSTNPLPIFTTATPPTTTATAAPPGGPESTSQSNSTTDSHTYHATPSSTTSPPSVGNTTSNTSNNNNNNNSNPDFDSIVTQILQMDGATTTSTSSPTTSTSNTPTQLPSTSLVVTPQDLLNALQRYKSHVFVRSFQHPQMINLYKDLATNPERLLSILPNIGEFTHSIWRNTLQESLQMKSHLRSFNLTESYNETHPKYTFVCQMNMTYDGHSVVGIGVSKCKKKEAMQFASFSLLLHVTVQHLFEICHKYNVNPQILAQPALLQHLQLQQQQQQQQQQSQLPHSPTVTSELSNADNTPVPSTTTDDRTTAPPTNSSLFSSLSAAELTLLSKTLIPTLNHVIDNNQADESIDPNKQQQQQTSQQQQQPMIQNQQQHSLSFFPLVSSPQVQPNPALTHALLSFILFGAMYLPQSRQQSLFFHVRDLRYRVSPLRGLVESLFSLLGAVVEPNDVILATYPLAPHALAVVQMLGLQVYYIPISYPTISSPSHDSVSPHIASSTSSSPVHHAPHVSSRFHLPRSPLSLDDMMISEGQQAHPIYVPQNPEHVQYCPYINAKDVDVLLHTLHPKAILFNSTLLPIATQEAICKVVLAWNRKTFSYRAAVRSGQFCDPSIQHMLLKNNDYYHAAGLPNDYNAFMTPSISHQSRTLPSKTHLIFDTSFQPIMSQYGNYLPHGVSATEHPLITYLRLMRQDQRESRQSSKAALTASQTSPENQQSSDITPQTTLPEHQHETDENAEELDVLTKIQPVLPISKYDDDDDNDDDNDDDDDNPDDNDNSTGLPSSVSSTTSCILASSHQQRHRRTRSSNLQPSNLKLSLPKIDPDAKSITDCSLSTNEKPQQPPPTSPQRGFGVKDPNIMIPTHRNHHLCMSFYGSTRILQGENDLAYIFTFSDLYDYITSNNVLYGQPPPPFAQEMLCLLMNYLRHPPVEVSNLCTYNRHSGLLQSLTPSAPTSISSDSLASSSKHPNLSQFLIHASSIANLLIFPSQQKQQLPRQQLPQQQQPQQQQQALQEHQADIIHVKSMLHCIDYYYNRLSTSTAAHLHAVASGTADIDAAPKLKRIASSASKRIENDDHQQQQQQLSSSSQIASQNTSNNTDIAAVSSIAPVDLHFKLPLLSEFIPSSGWYATRHFFDMWATPYHENHSMFAIPAAALSDSFIARRNAYLSQTSVPSCSTQQENTAVDTNSSNGVPNDAFGVFTKEQYLQLEFSLFGSNYGTQHDDIASTSMFTREASTSVSTTSMSIATSMPPPSLSTNGPPLSTNGLPLHILTATDSNPKLVAKLFRDAYEPLLEHLQFDQPTTMSRMAQRIHYITREQLYNLPPAISCPTLLAQDPTAVPHEVINTNDDGAPRTISLATSCLTPPALQHHSVCLLCLPIRFNLLSATLAQRQHLKRLFDLTAQRLMSLLPSLTPTPLLTFDLQGSGGTSAVPSQTASSDRCSHQRGGVGNARSVCWSEDTSFTSTVAPPSTATATGTGSGSSHRHLAECYEIIRHDWFNPRRSQITPVPLAPLTSAGTAFPCPQVAAPSGFSFLNVASSGWTGPSSTAAALNATTTTTNNSTASSNSTSAQASSTERNNNHQNNTTAINNFEDDSSTTTTRERHFSTTNGLSHNQPQPSSQQEYTGGGLSRNINNFTNHQSHPNLARNARDNNQRENNNNNHNNHNSPYHHTNNNTVGPGSNSGNTIPPDSRSNAWSVSSSSRGGGAGDHQNSHGATTMSNTKSHGTHPAMSSSPPMSVSTAHNNHHNNNNNNNNNSHHHHNTTSLSRHQHSGNSYQSTSHYSSSHIGDAQRFFTQPSSSHHVSQNSSRVAAPSNGGGDGMYNSLPGRHSSTNPSSVLSANSHAFRPPGVASNGGNGNGGGTTSRASGYTHNNNNNNNNHMNAYSSHHKQSGGPRADITNNINDYSSFGPYSVYNQQQQHQQQRNLMLSPPTQTESMPQSPPFSTSSSESSSRANGNRPPQPKQSQQQHQQQQHRQPMQQQPQQSFGSFHQSSSQSSLGGTQPSVSASAAMTTGSGDMTLVSGAGTAGGSTYGISQMQQRVLSAYNPAISNQYTIGLTAGGVSSLHSNNNNNNQAVSSSRQYGTQSTGPAAAIIAASSNNSLTSHRRSQPHLVSDPHDNSSSQNASLAPSIGTLFPTFSSTFSSPSTTQQQQQQQQQQNFSGFPSQPPSSPFFPSGPADAIQLSQFASGNQSLAQVGFHDFHNNVYPPFAPRPPFGATASAGSGSTTSLIDNSSTHINSMLNPSSNVDPFGVNAHSSSMYNSNPSLSSQDQRHQQSKQQQQQHAPNQSTIATSGTNLGDVFNSYLLPNSDSNQPSQFNPVFNTQPPNLLQQPVQSPFTTDFAPNQHLNNQNGNHFL